MGMMVRFEIISDKIELILNMNRYILNQVNTLLNNKNDISLVCCDSYTNAGVLSSLTHVITKTVAYYKANLLDTQNSFKSKGFYIRTSITMLM